MEVKAETKTTWKKIRTLERTPQNTNINRPPHLRQKGKPHLSPDSASKTQERAGVRDSGSSSKEFGKSKQTLTMVTHKC